MNTVGKSRPRAIPIDPITKKPISDSTFINEPSPEQDFDKKKKFFATATSQAKTRLEMIDLYDSIKKYNNEISNLIQAGLTTKSIEVLFDAKYIQYKDEVEKIFVGSNLQSSGAGGIPGEIPYLSPDQLLLLLNNFFGTTIRPTQSAALAELLNKIRTRREAISEERLELNKELGFFTDIGFSTALINAFYSKINDRLNGIGYGKVSNGKSIPLGDIYGFIKGLSKEKRQELMTVLINTLTSRVPIGSDSEILRRIREIRSTGINIQMNIVDYLLDMYNTVDINQYLHMILSQFLNNNKLQILGWTFPEFSSEEKKDVPEDIIKKGSIEDRIFEAINSTYNLTNLQTADLITIILQLRRIPNITDEILFDNIQNLLKQIIETSIANDNVSQITSSSSSVGPATVAPSSSLLLSNVLNKIRNNLPVIGEIGRLILNPTPNAIARIIQELITSLKNEQEQVESKSDLVQQLPIPPTPFNIDTYNEQTDEQLTQYFLTEPLDRLTINEPLSIEDLQTRMDDINEQADEEKIKEIIDRVLTEQEQQQLENRLNELKNPEIELDIDEYMRLEEKIINIEKTKPNMKQKLKKIMKELKAKFGKFSLVSRFYLKIKVGDEIITEKFNSRYDLGKFLSENKINAKEVIVKYGLMRDYTEDDRNLEEKYMYDKIKYDIENIPDGGGPPDDGGGEPPDDGGGEPSGGRGGRKPKPKKPIPRRKIFNGLTRRQYLLLLTIIILLSTGAVSLEEVLKAGKDLNDDGTTSTPPKTPPTDTTTIPTIPTDTTTDIPIVPDKPTKSDGSFNKITHNEFWDSVGLSGIIDNYNGMVDIYNKMPSKDKKEYQVVVEKYYNKFATTVNIPTLKELKEARRRYDGLKKQYDSSDGLSFDRINAIYIELKKSMTYLDEMTNKYLAVENQVFDIAKNKDDADVTIDDVDADISLQTKMNTSLGGITGGSNRAILDPSYALLSKGMRERIARKIQGKGDFSSGLILENQRFIDFSLVKPHEYPVGLGLDNPLVYRNKEYEIMQHRNNYANPQPYKVPSINRLIQISKQDKPQLHNVVQIDDRFNYDTGNTLISQKLQNPNVSPNTFSKSRLFNPEYHLEEINSRQKAINTMNDEIRCGPYVGIKDNQYYQYANIQKKQNDELNKYPMTKEFKIVKPTLPKTIKEQRKLPNSYSLK